MRIQRVCALYYSATGNTGKAALTLAEALAAALDVPMEEFPFTRPEERAQEISLGEGDLTVAGAPVYAGKLPNKLLPDFRTKLHGNGAPAIAVVTFGSRAYDNALAELCATLEADGFHTVAAGAFACRHAFTDALGEGRPGWDDLREIREFAGRIADKVRSLDAAPAPVEVPGDPDAPYYVPLGVDGQPAKFLKAKPQTDLAKCTGCGACARLCPMGAIDPGRVWEVPGTCIKCQRCVRKCTRHAKYFDDPAFLSHVAMLEKTYREPPKKNELFL